MSFFWQKSNNWKCVVVAAVGAVVVAVVVLNVEVEKLSHLVNLILTQSLEVERKSLTHLAEFFNPWPKAVVLVILGTSSFPTRYEV